jgi:DNA-binding response OmpR family regulator
LPEELTARVKALIRRSFTSAPQNIINYKTFEYDVLNKTLKK